MCDYSLETVKSVKAEKGATYRLGTGGNYTGSKGFEAADDCVACVPEGSVLRIQIAEEHQYLFGLTNEEDGVMTRVEIDNAFTHHDALRFGNGAVIKLQWMPFGTEARVIMLGDQSAPEDAALVAAQPSVSQVAALLG